MPLDFTKQEPDWDVLLKSIDRSEGGNKAKVRYGILSTKVKNKADARQIALNTARNNYRRWTEAGQPGNYINFLADRYVPAVDDPKGNAAWKKNVPAIYSQLAPKTPPKPSPAPNPAVPLKTSIFAEPLPYVGRLPQYPLPR